MSMKFASCGHQLAYLWESRGVALKSFSENGERTIEIRSLCLACYAEEAKANNVLETKEQADAWVNSLKTLKGVNNGKTDRVREEEQVYSDCGCSDAANVLVGRCTSCCKGR